MESSDRTIREKNKLSRIQIKAIPLHPQAEIPVRDNDDAGWTVTLVGRTDNRAEDDFGEMNGFSTGLQFSPPAGYYLEVVSLPDLYKHGYNLASGSIIISPNNKEELIIPLMKFRETNDLELPIQAVQVIVKKYVPVFMCKSKAVQQEHQYGQFMPPPMSSGYLPPNTTNPGYRGDMDQYQAFAQSQQGQRGKRPAAAGRPPQNHMF